MPKKGSAKKGSAKGSAKKKKPLTDDEKRVLEQQQADQARTRSELASRFLKEKLAQEQTNAVVNTKKLNQQWRQILRQGRVLPLS